MEMHSMLDDKQQQQQGNNEGNKTKQITQTLKLGSSFDKGRRRKKKIQWEEEVSSSSGSEMSPGKSDDEVDTSEFAQQLSNTFPQTHLVIRLSPTILSPAVSWFIRKLTGKKGDGGAELLVRVEPYNIRKAKESIVLHVTASKLKFLELAEYMELKKVDVEGVLREFTVVELDSFLHGEVGLDNLLTAAEKQMIVIHELENIRTLAGEECVPGYPTLSIFTGQSVFQIFLTEKLITSYYPLHEEEELIGLGEKWYWAFFQAQPFEEIRKYFGESISLYFSFLGFYTTSLCAPAILGILHLFDDFFFPDVSANYSLIFFCIFNVVWVTLTLELWKRKCSELAYSWGTLRMTKWEDPRSNFRGKMTLDPVTGRYQPSYPWWKTCVKVYCASFPVVLFCLFGAFYVMLYSFWVEEMLVEMQHKGGSQLASILVFLPSIIYAILVYIMNFYYRQLASHLTEWGMAVHGVWKSMIRFIVFLYVFLENHRTQSQFERHRVTKLVLFEFVNNFMSLFYIAFYLQDFELLKYQVFVMLIILQAINHVQEALLPLYFRKAYNTAVGGLLEKCSQLFEGEGGRRKGGGGGWDNGDGRGEAGMPSPTVLGVQLLEENDPRLIKSKIEGEMEPYEGTFDDYLEMFIQFGYVFLFSSVYPMAATWAVLNNVFEIRADAFKLCKVFQRPIAKRTKDIGAWQIAFEVMGVVAIMTNCGLLCLSQELRAYSAAARFSGVEWLLLFVVIEHALVALTLALRQLIPDVPYRVKMAMARLEFQSRQALKNEQAFKSRRQLTRRFKTIHGPRAAAVAAAAAAAAGASTVGLGPQKIMTERTSPSPIRRRIVPSE